MRAILFSILMICALGAQSQIKAIFLTGSDANTDTVTNAGTVYLTSPELSKYTTGRFSVTLIDSSISGTSTFKGILQGSMDGVKWENVHKTAGTNGVLCDTIQVTSAAPSAHTFTVFQNASTGASRFVFYRIACVGTGTQSTRVRGYILPIQ